MFLVLKTKGERLFSKDKTILCCNNHTAGFSIDTGEGVEGLGIAECLDAVPVTIHGKDILIGLSISTTPSEPMKNPMR